MTISRSAAIRTGASAMLLVVAFSAFASFSCYQMGLGDFLWVLGIALGPSLLIVLLCLFTKNPLRAIGASAGIGAWLGWAYHVDCVMPYQGGGASMSYVAVMLWGPLTALIGVGIAEAISRLSGIAIGEAARDRSAGKR